MKRWFVLDSATTWAIVVIYWNLPIIPNVPYVRGKEETDK